MVFDLLVKFYDFMEREVWGCGVVCFTGKTDFHFWTEVIEPMSRWLIAYNITLLHKSYVAGC